LGQIGQQMADRTGFGRAMGMVQRLAQRSWQGRLPIAGGPAAQQGEFLALSFGELSGFDRLAQAQLLMPGFPPCRGELQAALLLAQMANLSEPPGLGLSEPPTEKVLIALDPEPEGGSQGRIVDALRDDRGHDTPMLEAIRSVYEKGGVVAGTSAGAAIMSHVMYRDAPAPLEILREGVQLGRELDHGLGFLPPTWFVEQHCLVRGRFARALVAMHTEKIPHGIGVDENTALVVRRGRHATVIGYKGVLIMDASKAVSDDDAEGFTLTNVTLSYLDRGDAIDLETLAVTPSPEKADETALDPNAADFRPYYDQRMFYTDILGNATVADLMGRLIDNAESEAIGLAFSGLDAQNRPSDGFEFRFYRGPESRGWYTESFGGEDYTVLNIHLDILPIRISGPLYEQRRGRAGDRTMPDNAEPETETKEAVADTPGDEPAAP
jgi:cyanophycinase